ncbi:MAG: universal stress protein [Saprospiraceae bacterium]|nr:universal stress protein [Saprospiraceae bacterium]
MKKKILFPTDFSRAATNAFRYALKLADRIGGRIDLMSVYHLPLTDAGRVPPEYIDEMLKERREDIKKQMEEVCKGAPEELLGERIPQYGLFIYQEITEVAMEGEYNLIVMGTKGEHNPMEKLVGSVTTQTMMNAPCPVIAVPEDAQFADIERIAYATDFHPEDRKAIEQLMEIAGSLAAKVHFVHVDLRGDKEITDRVALKNYPFEFTEFSVITGPDLMSSLDDYVRRHSVQLLALFIPERRLWERLFHSSFTKRMTFHTKIPLLVFHQ